MPLAQVDPEAAQLTVGNVIAALMFVGIMGVSLLAVIYWGLKAASGQPMIPRVPGPGRQIPPALTIVVLCLSALFSVMAVATSLQGEELEPVPPVAALPGASDEAAQAEAAAGETMEGGDTQTDDAPPAARGEAVGDGSEPDAAGKPAVDEKQPVTDEELRENLFLIVFNIALQLFLLFVLGVVVLLTTTDQRGDNFRQAAVGEAGSGQPSEFRPTGPDGRADNPYAAPPVPRTDAPEFPDYVLSQTGDGDTALESTSNPYDDPSAGDSPVNPYDAGSAIPLISGEGSVSQPGFAGDFRYAVEAVLVVFLPVFVIRLITMLFVGDLEEHPFLEMLKSDGGGLLIVAILVGGVIVAPLSEELMYRVILCGGLSRLVSPSAAIVVSSLLFCLAHGLQDALGLMPLALILGYTYVQRKSYVCVVLIHVLFNGFSMLAALVSLIGS